MPKSRLQNLPWPRRAELPAAQGARRRRSQPSATPTTSNAARRSKSARPFGLQRQAGVFGVAPPRRVAGDTPSSSLLESTGLALATRLTRGFATGSKRKSPPAESPDSILNLLECMIQGKEYADQGNPTAVEWVKRPMHLLKSRSAKALAR